MIILIVGGGGMLGQKLARRLVDEGSLRGRAIERIILADRVAPDSHGSLVVGTSADITQPSECDLLVANKPDVIFHLAAVVSGQAEQDVDLGYQVNVDGTKHLLDAIRRVGEGYVPRVVFSSSVAVFGGPYPDVVPDDFHLTPKTSYGAQKAMGEMMISDYSRKGFIDGVAIRLPTVCVRPGAPNAAASGVFSNILREPLSGMPAVLSVPGDVSMVFCSPRTAVGYLVHAASIDTTPLGSRRALTMPGLTATIADQLDALARMAGDDVVSLITEKIDPVAEATVRAWDFPGFTADRALSLGFVGDSSVDELIQIFLDDDAPPHTKNGEVA